MVEHSRYNVGGDEGKILKNRLGITNTKTLEDTETLLLKDTYVHFFSLLQSKKLRFTATLLFQIHKYFLATLYDWAGKIRTVEISKNGILFCASSQIKRALKGFAHILKQNMPSPKHNVKTISKTFKTDYVKACIAGMQKDYSKMQKILHRWLSKNANF